MKNIRYKKKYLRNGISILILCLLTLSHTTRNSKRGGKRRKNADGDLKNGLPCVCFHLTHFDSILKVKLNILCVSHEVNFPLVCQDFGRSGAPLDERTMEKSPRSPRRIFLPSRSCSLMQSTVMSRMAGWRSLNAW